MSVQYVTLADPVLVSQSDVESKPWNAVWTLEPSEELNKSNVIGLGNWWTYIDDSVAAGARLSNNKVLNDQPVVHAQQPGDMMVQPLPWIDNTTALPTPESETALTRATRLVSYEHSSFISNRKTGQVSVHAWLNGKLYIQVSCHGEYRGPHPQLQHNSTYDTWLQTDQQSHTGLIPYLFKTSTTFTDRANDWVINAQPGSRVMHNMVLIPKRLSYHAKSVIPQVQSLT